MTVLMTTATSTRQFSYDAATTTFSAEVSSTNGLHRVYDDACDLGLVLVSSRTGRELVFVVTDEHYDREGDLTHWTLRSITSGYHMTLWND